MKKYIFACVLLLIISSGCSMNRNGASSSAKYEMAESENAYYNAPQATSAPARGGSSDSYLMGDAPAPMPSVSADRDATVPAPTGLMFIKTANIALSTEFFDNTVSDLR